MKKRAFLFIFLFLALFLSFSPEVKAEENIQESLEEEVAESVESLPLEEFEAFVQNLDSDFFQGLSVREFLVSLTSGKINLSPKEISSVCFGYLSRALVGTLPSLISIILVAVLFSLVFGLAQDFLHKQTVEILYFVCFAAIIAIVMRLVVTTVGEVRNAVNALSTLVNILFPLLLTLLTALGGSTTSAAFRPQIPLLCTVTINVISYAVIPLFIATIVFCIAGNLSQNVKLDKMQSTARYVAKILLSVTFGGLITYLSAVGLIGGASDAVSVKAAKYLVGSYVPILGGYLSQGLDLIAAGMILVKNALGVVGIFTVLAVTLTPAFKLIGLTLGLKLTASVIEPIADKRMSSFLNGVAESARSLLGATLGVSFVFIVCITLVIMTLNVGAL